MIQVYFKQSISAADEIKKYSYESCITLNDVLKLIQIIINNDTDELDMPAYFCNLMQRNYN